MSNWSELWKNIDKVELKGDTYMWKFYEALLNGFDFTGKNVLEIGCGAGINTIMMGMKGARITFLDMSSKALSIARKNARRFGLKARYIQGDAFGQKFRGEYDLVHSEGLIEHFLEARRQEIVDAHARAAKRGGRVVIIVPNSMSAPYRIGKCLAEKTGTWVYGNEYPYTKRELIYRINRSGIRINTLMGGQFLFSFTWAFAPLWLTSKNMLRTAMGQGARKGVSRADQNNFFANRWGRVLGVSGVRI